MVAMANRRYIDGLSEDDLFSLNYTDRRQMSRSSCLGQHELVHRQMSAFSKLLQHAISRFSTDKLYSMLRHLARYTPEGDTTHCVTSLRDVREILETLRSEKQRKGEETKDDEAQYAVKYFQTFLEDIAYLKQLKKYFDVKIHMCLYEFYYDPREDDEDLAAVLEESRRYHMSHEEDKDSGMSSLTESDMDSTSNNFSLADEEDLEVYFDTFSDKQKLSVVVRKMYLLNQKWDTLLQEEVIDENLLDKDSGHDMSHFAERGHFELLLRLVPDLFVKAYKSIELAKLWWTQSSQLQGGAGPAHGGWVVGEYRRAERGLERQIDDLRADLTRDEQLKALHTADLKHVQDREQRYKVLSEQCARLEERRNYIGERYNAAVLACQAMRDSLILAGNSTPRPGVTHYHRQLHEARDELKLVNYHLDLVQGDFGIELLVRADLIRFEADIVDRMTELQRSMEQHTQGLRESEKRLVLLRTNCCRMRVIMQRYGRLEKRDAGGGGEAGGSVGGGGEQHSRKGRDKAYVTTGAKIEVGNRPGRKEGLGKREMMGRNKRRRDDGGVRERKPVQQPPQTAQKNCHTSSSTAGTHKPTKPHPDNKAPETKLEGQKPGPKKGEPFVRATRARRRRDSISSTDADEAGNEADVSAPPSSSGFVNDADDGAVDPRRTYVVEEGDSSDPGSDSLDHDPPDPLYLSYGNINSV